MSDITARIVECLANADYPALEKLYAPDVVLDMNLPTWRFQRRGAGEIGEYFRQNTGHLPNLRCTYLNEIATTDATTTVESECRFDGDGGEYLWRCVDSFTVDDARISRHVQHSVQYWTSADIAR